MTPQRELWACALLVEKQHGADAPRFIAERIGALELAGDDNGVERWRSIACCLDALGRKCDTACMTKEEMREKRAELQSLLGKFEAGRISGYEEDDRGLLERDVSQERIDSLRERIADLDRMLSEDWRT